MKKAIFILGFLGLIITNSFTAQNDSAEIIVKDTIEEATAEEEVTAVEEEVIAVEESSPVVEEVVEEETSVSQSLKLKFIEGGPLFMSFVLIALILGLALSIERIIYLNLATTNSKKLLEDIENALSNGGVDAAKEVCRNTRGPVASIFLQGLERSSEGVEMVEKSVIAYGGVQMGLLERGLSWIGLFIALAPMLGFMGTVIGMIQAFDIIELKGEAKPDELAGGIKVALITTVSGLIVAIILQIFYNYIVSKIDSLVNQMEDASISLIDVLVKHNLGK
ncbi:MAG: MotA/TolQ/ExbB proton channel family protein [Flavobacteriales bacterium]|jgi:biopolymer transport protein ExbB|nr:MotA/TolQ/ExbB proton channel family protein [Flavobacteriales bacterium]MDG1440969.1 MotA/TolQ/ExbB proton channel family protein [Flavobacteriales bacterium]